MQTNEEREEDAMNANADATPYENLVAPYPVWAALHECGVERDSNWYHHVIGRGLFHDDFRTCIDLGTKELESYFKTMAALKTNNQGKIPLAIEARNSMAAFVQWTKDKIRCGKDPAMHQFENTGISALLKRAKTHERFIEDASSDDKPGGFTKDLKWDNWSPDFENYLRITPGSSGVPLIYVIRENDAPDPTPTGDFLEDYIMNAPLSGDNYKEDRRTVHNMLKSLISDNPESEALIKLMEREANGRKDWKVLKLHYE